MSSHTPMPTKSILFIDSGVADYQSLLDGVRPGTEIVLLDANRDGVMQITAILNQRCDIGSVHILSHGHPAAIVVGNTSLTPATMDTYRPALQSWRTALTKTAEIFLYGCRVAKGVTGEQFVRQLSATVQASMAAAIDLSGAKALGGNWDLAFRCGQINTPLIFEQNVLNDYSGTLATETISFGNHELNSSGTNLPVLSYTKATTGYGNLTIKPTDSGTSTAFASLAPMSGANNGLWDASYRFSYTSGITVWDSSFLYQKGIWFAFATASGGEFDLVSIDISEAYGNLNTIEILGYRDGFQVATDTPVALTTAGAFQTVSLPSSFDNVDEVRIRHISTGAFDYTATPSQHGMVYGNFVFQPILVTITSATYDASTNSLVVTGTNMTATAGALNDIDVSKLTLTGQGGATYTLTSSNVELDSATQFTVALNAADQLNVEGLLNDGGTSSVGGTTYNIAAAANWNPAQSGNADLTGNGIAVSNVQLPTITSAAYDISTGVLAVTGTNLVKASGAANDIDASMLTLTGEGGFAYTLTDTSDVEITSSTSFTLTLSSTDKTAVNRIFNKNGTSSTDGTTYKLTAADDWNTIIGSTNIGDTTGNTITVSNVPVPTIASATYDAGTGTLAVTGSGFLKSNGFNNDIVVSKFTFTGEGGSTYRLTDSVNVEITSSTAFTITLNATDKAAVNQIVNKDGTVSTGGTAYNLAAAEDWAAGAGAAVNVVDTTGNAITASNVVVPVITSATYNTGTGALVVTGSGFLKAGGAANDIDASKFMLTGEGNAIYTLTDTVDVEITSGTTFTLMLSNTDKAAVNLLLNKTGTASDDATTYNLAAAEDWATGADPAATIADTNSNGITVSISSSGGGGSGSGGGGNATTTTVDGTTVITTTQVDGSIVIDVPTIQSSRQDDPDSLFRDYADIPVAKDTKGNPLLTVSLPTGTGAIVAERPRVTDPAQAETSVTAALARINSLSSDAINNLATKARAFLAQLPDSNPVNTQTVTLNVAGGQPPTLPFIISSPAVASTTGNMLVIDAHQLPAGTAIQLDNVAFALIVGATRIVGGSGQNFAVGDDQNQFIVLGADDDILFGGGGDDTVGSLDGNDQTSGDAGNDIVYGGTGNDILNGGTGNDQINGGLGFDRATQAGQLSDYRIDVHGNTVTLTQANGETDTLTDVELVRFANGSSLAVAYSEIEAAAHHLARTWLGRDLTTAEGSAVQTWAGATTQDILAAFRSLPEAGAYLNKTDSELLIGWDTDPTIIQVDAVRNFTGGTENNQGYLPLGLALNADGGAGHDVLLMPGSRDDVHLEFSDNQLELTQLSDGAILSLKNAEMIAFDNGDTVVIAHNETEAVLARLVHSFLDRDVAREEWQSGREALAAQVSQDTILAWLQQQAGLQSLSDKDFTQTIYIQTLGRSATGEELDKQLSRLQTNTLSRDKLAIEVAQSTEAATHLVGSVMLQHEWV